MSNTFNKETKLERINMIVTKYCNLHCRTCDFEELRPSETDPSLDEIKLIINEGSALGMKTLEITGGEPMTRRDIYEIVSYASSLGLNVIMSTNGVLIGEAKARKLIEAGLTAIVFSLEGPESINDYIRGSGNYKKTLNVIKNFLGHCNEYQELRIGISITLTKLNYKVIYDFCKYLLENVGVHYILINPYNKMMLNPLNQLERDKEFSLSSDEIKALVIEIDKMIEYTNKNPFKLPAEAYLSKIPDYFKGDTILPSSGCALPSIFCGISFDGWVFPCWNTYSVGKLKEGNLSDIFSKEAHKEFETIEGKCKGCLNSV